MTHVGLLNQGLAFMENLLFAIEILSKREFCPFN